jgi:prolyl-tRNA synthetase
MGVVVEKFADEKGLVWPESIAPFSVHLLVLGRDKDGEAVKTAEKIYDEFIKNHVEVLFDDRDVSVGEKFADSDLLGIPMRLVVSDKSLEKGGVEIKERKSESSEILSVDQVIKMYSKNCC